MFGPDLTAARDLPLGQHPADDAENFLTVVAFKAALVADRPIAQRMFMGQIVDRRMIHDQLRWRSAQRVTTLNDPIFLDAVARSKR